MVNTRKISENVYIIEKDMNVPGKIFASEK
jgi:hypothetical protein